MKTRLFLCCIVVLALALLAVTEARADLVINAAGAADGFTATNFATGFPNITEEGPFGLTVVGNGSGGANVLVSDAANGIRYVFNDVDGQTVASALTTLPSNSSGSGYATLNGVAYGADNGSYGRFTSTGVFTPFNITGLPGPGLGMAADTVTGELITTSSAGLIAINPTTNTFRIINAALKGITPQEYDGVSVSPDGQTVYIAQFLGNVTGYNVQTGALVFTGAKPAGTYQPDGTAVISSNNGLNGDIIVNDNLGNLYLLNPVTNIITLIGTNTNERGDYVSPDSTNGTLLLDYTDEVERLSCGPNCSIGSVSTTPEPGTFMLLGIGLLGLGAVAKRKLL